MGALTRMAAAAAVMALPYCASAQFSATTPLPQALHSHSAVILSGRIYVAGGVSDSGSITGGAGYLSNVYYCADVRPDGTLGAWKTASPMPEFLGLGMHASAVYNGRIYVLGGTNLLGPRNVVYFSGANADGTLSGWQATTPMPQKVAAHSAAVYGNRIYVTGGSLRSSGATSLTYSAPVNADGTLGEWRYETPLPSTLFGHSSFARAGRLFVLGGSAAPRVYGEEGVPAGDISDQVYSAVINADGTLGAWEVQPPLPARMDFYGMAVTDKSAYVLGGFDGAVLNSVYFSPFSAAGTLGAWQPLQVLPANLLALAAVATPDYLYSIGGGLSYIDDPVSGIYFAKVKADPRAFVKLTPSSLNKGSNGKWVTVIIGLPEADVASVQPASVKISAVNGQSITPIQADPKWTAKLYAGDSAEFSGMAGVSYLMLKFSRQAVADIAPEGEFSITVSGLLSDGRTFSGESMNRAFSRQPRYAELLQKRDGERKGPGGVKVSIPKGSFKGNPELLLMAAPEEDAAVGVQEKEKRSKDMKAGGLSAASKAFEFGPHGMAFEKPVTISLPYDQALLPAGADEGALKVAYWNSAAAKWEVLPSVVSKGDRLVSAQTSHFSVYQVMLEAVPTVSPPAPSSQIGQVYVFPNPAKGGARPALRAETPAGDGLHVRVYSSSGRLVHEGGMDGAPGTAGPAQGYELALPGDLPSGVYYYQAEVRNGGQKFKKAGKFAVVR